MSGMQWFAIVLAPLVAAGLTGAMMYFAPRWGLVDHPGQRKVHVHPTPLVGGVSILLTLLVLQVALGYLPFDSWTLTFALFLVAGIGMADDTRALSHGAKFAAQTVGALMIVSGTSVWVTHMGDILGLGTIELGKWALIVTVISCVGVMNAINMIDGLDGLAGTVSLVSVVLMAYLAMMGNSVGMMFELLLFAGAILGFLSFNFRLPGRSGAMVFMGDTGGMVIGMLLAWYSIKFAGLPSSPIRPITAVWVLAVPLLDMGSVMLLRLHQGKSPFRADQQHMHHVLLRAGYTVNQIVAIMAGFSFLCGLAGVVADRNGVPEAAMFAIFLVLWGAYVVALKYSAVVQVLANRLIPPASPRSGSGLA